MALFSRAAAALDASSDRVRSRILGRLRPGVYWRFHWTFRSRTVSTLVTLRYVASRGPYTVVVRDVVSTGDTVEHNAPNSASPPARVRRASASCAESPSVTVRMPKMVVRSPATLSRMYPTRSLHAGHAEVRSRSRASIPDRDLHHATRFARCPRRRRRQKEKETNLTLDSIKAINVIARLSEGAARPGRQPRYRPSVDTDTTDDDGEEDESAPRLDPLRRLKGRPCGPSDHVKCRILGGASPIAGARPRPGGQQVQAHLCRMFGSEASRKIPHGAAFVARHVLSHR